MVISQIISRLQRNTLEQITRIRELERRLKEVERNFDPTALIVPDDEGDFFGVGRIFNAISVNSVDEENPDTVFQDDGTFRIKNTSPSAVVERRALVRFENPGFSKLIFGAFINIGSVVQTVINDSGGFGSYTVNFDILGPFDPTTVTWNNQPSGSFISQSLIIGSGWPGTALVRTYTTTITGPNSWTFLPLGDSLDSIRIRLTGGGGDSAGDNTTGIVTIDKNGLSSNSSFYVGLGPVSKITCGDDFGG